MLYELPSLIIQKKKREKLWFIIFMSLSLVESIVILVFDELPSIASVIERILTPVIKLIS